MCNHPNNKNNGYIYKCEECGEFVAAETFEQQIARKTFEELKEIRSILSNIYDYMIMRDR
jgi:hypothetical protein